MTRVIKTLGAVASLFAGMFVLLGAGDVSAAPFKRIGVGYCGSDQPKIVNSSASDFTFQCTIPSDDLLEHADVTSLQVYLTNNGSFSVARACVMLPSGSAYICGTGETSGNATVNVSPELSKWGEYPTAFPYVRVTLGPGSVLLGIKIAG